jgi:hypothetical protein
MQADQHLLIHPFCRLQPKEQPNPEGENSSFMRNLTPGGQLTPEAHSYLPP